MTSICNSITRRPTSSIISPTEIFVIRSAIARRRTCKRNVILIDLFDLRLVLTQSIGVCDQGWGHVNGNDNSRKEEERKKSIRHENSMCLGFVSEEM